MMKAKQVIGFRLKGEEIVCLPQGMRPKTDGRRGAL
jgi:hypothetical protein